MWSFAVLIRAALDRHLPARRTTIWLVVTWAGLALFLVARPAADPSAPEPASAGTAVIVGSAIGLLAVLAAHRAGQDRTRGLLLGAAAGLLFGLVAGLAKLVIIEAGRDWTRVLAHWPLWALVAVGVCAVVVNQHAYQAARLSVTAPVLNIVQVVVAIAFGAIVLGEDPGSSAIGIVGQVMGLGLVGLGIWHLVAEPGSGSQQTAEQPEASTSRRP